MQIRAYAAFVFTFLGFVLFDYAGPGSLLSQAYYVAWLYPAGFVLLGAVLVRSAPAQRFQHALLLVVAGALLVSITAPSWFNVSENPLLTLATAGALAVLAAAARSSGLRTLALTGVLLCVHGELPGYGPQTRHADLFPVVDRGAQFIARFRMSMAPGLLLATDDARRPYAEGVSAVYLWNYSLVSSDFARLTGDEASRVVPGMIVVIIADDPSRGSTFNDVFSAYGIEGHVLGSERVDTAEGPLYFTALRAETLRRVATARHPGDTQHTRAPRTLPAGQ
jgi:hypothetical protein